MKTICVSYKVILILLTLFITLTLPSRSEAQTYTHIYVDAVKGMNAPTGRGSSANPYKSITYALLISAKSNLADPWHVHIRPGTYDADPAKPPSEREIFPINLRSGMIFEGTTTAEACVIDAQHLRESKVPILSGQDVGNVRIRNLTIQNMNGTGIVLNDAAGTQGTSNTLEACIVHNNNRDGLWTNMSLVLTRNTFSNNREEGVKVEGNSTADISENTFQSNSSRGFYITGELRGNVTHNIFTGNPGSAAGGFRVGYFTGDITHNTFTGNSGDTGGFEVDDNFTGDITHNTFDGNSGRFAGGFYAGSFTGDITHNTFTGNSGVSAGGFWVWETFTGDITHNTFDGNSSDHYGGGFVLERGESSNKAQVSNNVFFNNIAEMGGFSVRTRRSTHFTNNLFMVKDAKSGGSAVWLDSPDCRFHNNIFSGMQTAIYTEGAFDLPITHNIFHDIKQDIVSQGGAGVGNDVDFWELLSNNASDNLAANPQFVDPEIDHNFQLRSTSPAINAGTNAFAPTDDFAGVARPIRGTVDIGPYEFGGTPRPSTPARFTFNLPASVEAGKRFTAELTMDQAQHVAGISLTLHFDPAVIEVKDVQEGDFLLGDGTTAPFFQVDKIDNVRGVLSGVKLTRKVGTATGGVLLKVVCEAKSAGVSTIDVRNVKLGNTAGQSIPVETTAGTVAVTPAPEAPEVSVSVDPDVTGDGRVDILDLVMVSRHFGPASDAPAGVDVNKDGNVDILDLILVSQHL